MFKALTFATLAAIGNALFVYGQRRANPTDNPFIFMAGAVTVCTLLFITVSLLFRDQQEIAYVSTNLSSIIISGIGFFVTFLGFYLLYSRFGASYYIIYAVLSIITTSVGVGVVIYKEVFNIYHLGALSLAILAIILFFYGNQIASG